MFVAYFLAGAENLQRNEDELRDTTPELVDSRAYIRVPARVQHVALHEAVRAAEAGGATPSATDGQPDARLS